MSARFFRMNLIFVLSGFLISGIPCDAEGGDRYLRNFYARMTVRNMPLHFAHLVLVLSVLPSIRLPLHSVQRTSGPGTASLAMC